MDTVTITFTREEFAMLAFALGFTAGAADESELVQPIGNLIRKLLREEFKQRPPEATQ